MILSIIFLIRWLFLIAFVASVFATFSLLFSQSKEDIARRFYVVRNPKFRSTSMMKNETVLVGDTVINFGNVKIEAKSNDNEISVQIFYYPWYGNPEFDNGKYYHWDHQYIPHWDPVISKLYPTGTHIPPTDIGSSFYPLLGPYSSRDPDVIEQHMKWLSSAGVNVIITSWFPRKVADEQGYPWDDLIPVLLNAVQKYGMKLSFHMEPYKNRDGKSLRTDIEYIIDTYGSNTALYRRSILRKKNYKLEDKNYLHDVESSHLPLLYFYDSYVVPLDEWKKLTMPTGEFTVRGSKYDVLFVGLLVNLEDRHSLLDAGFDGMYTYFAAKGFSYGSTPSNWPSLSAFCRENNLLFIPSVGPGYDDRRVRPWNEVNYRNRLNGDYYAQMFEMAHIAKASIVTITSFNEWHEGTQIEPAVSFTDNITNFVYNTFEQGPEQYLHLTFDLIKRYFTPLGKIVPEKVDNEQ